MKITGAVAFLLAASASMVVSIPTQLGSRVPAHHGLPPPPPFNGTGPIGGGGDSPGPGHGGPPEGLNLGKRFTPEKRAADDGEDKSFFNGIFGVDRRKFESFLGRLARDS